MNTVACGSIIYRRAKGAYRCESSSQLVLTFVDRDNVELKVYRCNQHGEAIKRACQLRDMWTDDQKFKLIDVRPIE